MWHRWRHTYSADDPAPLFGGKHTVRALRRADASAHLAGQRELTDEAHNLHDREPRGAGTMRQPICLDDVLRYGEVGSSSNGRR
jgi:hypothetical protein